MRSFDVSKEFAMKRVTAPDIRNRKGGSPVVALAAYHARPGAAWIRMSICCWWAIPLAWWMHGYETTVRVH